MGKRGHRGPLKKDGIHLRLYTVISQVLSRTGNDSAPRILSYSRNARAGEEHGLYFAAQADELRNLILYQVGRLGFTGFILQGVYWIMRGLLAQV